MPYEIVLRAQNDDPLYMRSVVIKLAHITPEFLILCEKEGLVQAQTMTGGGEGFDAQSIQRLALIRRLHRELELDLETIELVIHLRSQIVDLYREIDDLEKQARRREKSLLAEIQLLRRQQIKTQDMKNIDHEREKSK